jgi:hypothetical protein
MQARGLDFLAAMRLLGDYYGMAAARPLTGTERQQYRQRRAAAEPEAVQLVAWRDRLLEALRETRNSYLAAYHRSKRYILGHGLDAPLGNLAADLGEYSEEAYKELDLAIERIQDAPWPVLRDLYHRSRGPQGA